MMSVLFVDDSPVFREQACIYFKRNGWKTEAAGDGKAAIAILAQRGHDFDAVVLDRAMPELEGDEVLRWMRKQAKLTDTCVVIVTQYGGLESAIEMLKLGAFHYLKKAVDLGNLQDVLRAGVTWHRAHKMRRELLKTLDSTRILSEIVNVLRDALGSDLVHPIFFRPDGKMQRVGFDGTATDGTATDETPRHFIHRICAGELAISEGKQELVAQLGPFVKEAGSLIAVPIMGTQNQVRGVLEVESKQDNAFSQSWVDVLRYLADLIGIGLEIGEEAERVRAVYRDLRHNIATHVQIVAIQARRMQQMISASPLEPVESMHDHVRFIVDNATVIERMVQDIKAIAVDPPKLRIQPVDVIELAKQSLCEQTPKFEDLKISARVESANGPILLNTDRDSLAYSLRCLINNAAESIQDNRQQYGTKEEARGDRIILLIRDAGAFVEIRIDDTGIGFDKETASKLFLPLFSTKARHLPSGQQSQESTGIDRVERLLEFMERWCRQDPRSRIINDERRPLERGMELFIRDGDTLDMYIGHRDRKSGGLDPQNLEASSVCHVGTDSPLAAELFGHGEGLFSVRKYVARLGGTVFASSQGIGRGATLTITLPKS